MALTREARALVTLLAVVAVATPLMVLTAAPAAPVAEEVASATLALPAPPPLGAALTRPLFGAATATPVAAPDDAPALVGIVGRLNIDAVALVRTAQGTTRTLAPGQGVDGWQLRALAIDAAFFTRGGQEVRVPLAVEE